MTKLITELLAPVTLAEHHPEIVPVSTAPMGLLLTNESVRGGATVRPGGKDTGLQWEMGFHLPPGAGGSLRERGLTLLGHLRLSVYQKSLLCPLSSTKGQLRERKKKKETEERK